MPEERAAAAPDASPAAPPGERVAVARDQRSPPASDERDFRTVADQAPVVLALTDPDGKLTYVGAPWFELTGQSPGAALGDGWLEAVHPDDRACARTGCDGSAECEGRRCDYRVRRRDGEYRWCLNLSSPRFDAHGRWLGSVRCVVDITDRKEAEERLRIGEERLRLAQTVTGVATWDWDIVNDRAVVSPEWFRLGGLPVGSWQPRMVDWAERIHPDDRAAAVARLEEALAGNASFFEDEHRVVWPDGSVHYVLSRGRIHRDANGRPVRMIGVLVDVTGRRELAERFQEIERLEAVGRLAGGVAHEVNNQMTVVLGLTDMILAKRDIPEAIRRDLEEVCQAAWRSSEIARQMLAYSRRQVLRRERTDVNELVRGLEPSLRRTLGPNHRLAIELAIEELPVHVDRLQIEQVLSNLVANARDAMAQGGLVTIATSKEELGEADVRSWAEAGAKPGRYACMAVRDTGHGMSKETLAHAFDPFFTTKPVGKGTGLGLSMAHGIVKQHDGFVIAESAPDRGSTFRIYVPCADVLEAAWTAGHARRPVVLFVDDEAAVRDVAARALEAEGFVVFTAGDGVDAIRMLDRHGPDLDLVVTDLVMPGMDGREVARAVAARRPGLPVLATSGYSEANVIGEGLLEKGAPYLPKPFSPSQLVERCRELVRERVAPFRAPAG